MVICILEKFHVENLYPSNMNADLFGGREMSDEDGDDDDFEEEGDDEDLEDGWEEDFGDDA